jgi:hypothetical protein
VRTAVVRLTAREVKQRIFCSFSLVAFFCKKLVNSMNNRTPMWNGYNFLYISKISEVLLLNKATLPVLSAVKHRFSDMEGYVHHFFSVPIVSMSIPLC